MSPEEAWTRDAAALRAIPAAPRPVTGAHNALNAVRLFADYLLTCPPRMQRATQWLRSYPAPFEKVHFRARDGVRLAAWMGRAADEPRDGVLLLPGLWTSKDNHRIRERSLRLLRQWGVHVFTLDLRGVGESDRVPMTPGWKEAEDIIDALAEFRRRAPIRRLHLYTESLAASAALLAAAQEGRAGRRLLNGRVVSMSPFASAHDIMRLYSHPNPRESELGQDFTAVQTFFNFLLRIQGFRGGRFDAYSRMSAAHYGLDEEESLARSSPGLHACHINVPTLIVHSEDDGLVPVSQAHQLRAAAAGNPNVDVWVLPWGYHCLYEMAEPTWYWDVLGRVYGSARPVAAPA